MRHFLTVFFIFLCTTLAHAQKRLPGEKPKLIVQVVVGQMRADCLLRFKENLKNEGFKTLMNEGAYCQNARYSHLLTQTAPGLATIATGAAPAQHGIISNLWYDRTSNSVRSACYDSRVSPLKSSNDKLKKSSRSLLASTFGDELKLFSKKSKVIGVGMEPEEAILLSGHNVNAAYFFDDMSGKFVSTDYYMEQLPAWVQIFNSKKFTETYLNRNWETLYQAREYESYTPDTSLLARNSNAAKSPITIVAENAKKGDKRPYQQLRDLPYSDNLVKDFAISAIVNEQLGKDKITDMITIYFGALRNIGNRYGQLSVELEDAFYRTDENIKHLLAFLNDYVGKENLLFVLTSDHGANLSQQQLEAANMPLGTFDHNKALILLRSYMGIVYGKGDWVKAFSQKQIFLNHTLIEDSNLRLAEVQERAANFMLQFSGVAAAVTAHTLANTTFTSGMLQAMQSSFFQKRSGDIIINLEPGWVETSNESTANSAYSYDTHVPLAFYGWRIKRKTISSTIDITDVAPTLSTLVGIEQPNAASGRIIGELLE
jgi:predicted AlkP superfamily pyrophosphatase or phosphodiesterase